MQIRTEGRLNKQNIRTWRELIMVHNVIFLGVCVLGGGGGGGGSRRQGNGRVAGTGKGGGGFAENRSVLSCRMFYALCLH